MSWLIYWSHKKKKKKWRKTFPASYPKHLPEVRVSESEGDVWDMEAFWGPFGLRGVTCRASRSCASCAALYTHLPLGRLFCLSLWWEDGTKGNGSPLKLEKLRKKMNCYSWNCVKSQDEFKNQCRCQNANMLTLIMTWCYKAVIFCHVPPFFLFWSFNLCPCRCFHTC